jgi:hypothetical protein
VTPIRTSESLPLFVWESAVRNHLSALERDDLIRTSGVRRSLGAGKPAAVCELHPATLTLLSRANPQVLGILVDVMRDQRSIAETESMLREVGRRLAKSVGGTASGSATTRIQAAANSLHTLSGDAVIPSTYEPDESIIRGAGCPMCWVTKSCIIQPVVLGTGKRLLPERLFQLDRMQAFSSGIVLNNSRLVEPLNRNVRRRAFVGEYWWGHRRLPPNTSARPSKLSTTWTRSDSCDSCGAGFAYLAQRPTQCLQCKRARSAFRQSRAPA